MVSEVTNGVRISVECYYQEQISHPLDSEFVFAYRIRIENESGATVRLLRRHWDIKDSNGLESEVDGKGVQGLQPTIKPSAYHEYASWCRLRSEIGKMSGWYMMHNIEEDRKFKVHVPEFQMIAPMKLN
ncbi:MAG: ApaG protein [Limisphaerales bacterium]|jgi:ApaG protein